MTDEKLIFDETSIEFDDERDSSFVHEVDIDSYLDPPEDMVMEAEIPISEDSDFIDINDFVKKAKPPEIRLPIVIPGDKKSTIDDKIVAAVGLLKDSDVIFGKKAGLLYRYKADIGYFRFLSADIDDTNSLADLIIKKASKIGSDEVVMAALKKHLVKQIYHFIVKTPGCALKLGETPPTYVNFRNVVVDVRTLKTQKHNSIFGFTSYVDCDFRADAVMGSTASNFFKNLAPDPRDRRSLLQVIGLSLIGPKTFDRSAFIIGSPANGKSTLAKLIEALLPDDACQNLDLNLLGDKFARVKLADAQVSICHDLANEKVSQEAIATFKNLVTHDPIEGRDLYQSYRKIKPKCFMVFIGNDLPIFNDASGAIRRRQWLIKTGPTVPEKDRDPYLLEKLLHDKVGIVASAIRAVHDAQLLDRPGNVFSNNPEDFQPCYVSYDLNAVETAWVQQHLVPNGNIASFIPVSKIREAFIADIPQEYRQQVSENGFARALRKILPPTAFFAKRDGVSCLFGHDLK